jgi:hypothetical protein
MNKIVNIHNPTVLRFPVYMCDLNPFELVWVRLENLIKTNNVSGCINMSRLKELELKGIS